jgi:iron complex transport system ATP-binding protein
MSSLVAISDVRFGYNGIDVLVNVSLLIEQGQRWAVIGKNGAGKSTLVRCIAGLERIRTGSVSICGRDIADYSPRQLARVIAYVPQAQSRPIPFTVFDYVLMGRFPYQGFMATPTNEDLEIVRDALAMTDTSEFTTRAMGTLSGGELQRVLLAGAVSQQTDILLLDEPTTFLDPLHRELLHRALERIHREFNTTVVTVTHDINDSIERHTNVLALVAGQCFFAGSSGELLSRSPDILNEIYGIEFVEARSADGTRRIMTPSTSAVAESSEGAAFQ